MEGYRLTTKGFLSLTLLFFAIFVVLTTILWYANSPKPLAPKIIAMIPFSENSPEIISPTAGSLLPASPSDPTPGNVAPTQEIVTPTPGNITTAPENVAPTPGNDNDNQVNSSLYPFASGDELLLSFPFGESGLSEQNRDDLRSFFTAIPDMDLENLILVIEGRAYANEASGNAAVSALARDRMSAVYMSCMSLRFDIEMISNFEIQPIAAAAPDVVGASLMLIR